MGSFMWGPNILTTLQTSCGAELFKYAKCFQYQHFCFHSATYAAIAILFC